jgi:acyl-CoA thioesterase I
MSGIPLVICFGDSLTAGYQSPTRDNPTGRETPYGQFLQSYVGDVVQVRISGICGELTGEMVMRFRRDVLDHQPGYVLILGGTNDLGWNASPSEIMGNLSKMYEQTIAMGAVPIPVTVPSIRVEDAAGSREGQEWVAEHLTRRSQLNKLIQDYAGSKGIACVDLFTVTAEPESRQLAAVYSNDGIHLTTAGYRLFAEHVAQVLKPLLSQSRPIVKTVLKAVTDREFDRVVEASRVPVLVEFWKPGCGHCRALMKELERLQQELGDRVLVLTMNVEENFQIPAELEVSSLPALALYRYGEFVKFIGGLAKRDVIVKQIQFAPPS